MPKIELEVRVMETITAPPQEPKFRVKILCLACEKGLVRSLFTGMVRECNLCSGMGFTIPEHIPLEGEVFTGKNCFYAFLVIAPGLPIFAARLV